MKSKKETLEKIVDRRRLLLNPISRDIAKYLQNEGKADSDQIAEALNLPENETGVYLGELNHAKLIGGRFRRKGQGMAMYFHITRKGRKYLEAFPNY